MRPPPLDDPADEIAACEPIPPAPRSLYTSEELEARTKSTMRPRPKTRNAS